MDFDSAMERYAIMTEQKDVTEDQALKYIAKHTTKDVFKKLYIKVKNNDNVK